MRLFSLICLALAAAALVSPAGAQQGPAPSPARDIAFSSTTAAATPLLTRADVDAWLDGFLPYALQRGDIAGAMVVVVKDGQILTEKGYGYADVAKRIPVDPARTLFRPGSVGKLFTWTAVMQLVEQGRIDLDADVNRYLDFTIPPRDGKPVTMRNLMTHTPGFEERVKGLISYAPNDAPPLGAYLKSWVPRRIFAPGEVPAYSNYGVTLAGYIVARVSGETYDDYIDRHVLAPLGMADSTFRQPLPARFVPRMSNGYQLGSGPAKPYELFAVAPAGSLAATGDDMGRFMIAHLQQGQFGDRRILRPETARLMHGFTLPVLPPLDSMALGFFRTDYNGHRIIAHGGDTQFFHSYLHLFLDEGVGFYITFNSSGREGAAIPLRTSVFQQFTDRYFPAAALAGSVDARTAAAHAKLITGVYESSRRSEAGYFSAFTLLGQVKVAANPDGSISASQLTGVNGKVKRWREVAPFVWRDVDGKERLAARVENGRVVMFGVDGLSPFQVFQPVSWWRSSALLLPLLLGAVAALALTAAAWPVIVIARRRAGGTFRLTGGAALTHRLVKLGAIGALAYLGAWVGIMATVASDIGAISTALDPWLWALRVASLAVFAAAAAAAWNVWLVWSSRRGWFDRLWSIVLALAFPVVLWFAMAARLISFNANY